MAASAFQKFLVSNLCDNGHFQEILGEFLKISLLSNHTKSKVRISLRIFQKMWPIPPLETVVWPHLLKKLLIGIFIFCAVSQSLMNMRFLKISSLLQFSLN